MLIHRVPDTAPRDLVGRKLRVLLEGHVAVMLGVIAHIYAERDGRDTNPATGETLFRRLREALGLSMA